MYDASSRKDIRKAEKAAAAADRDRVNYLVAAMGTVQGRVWFYDLLAFCHCFDDPFTGNALLEAYRKGERNVGLRVFADISRHCPELYQQMMAEANHRELANGRRDTNRTDDRTAGGEYPGGEDAGWDDTGLSDSDPGAFQ